MLLSVASVASVTQKKMSLCDDDVAQRLFNRWTSEPSGLPCPPPPVPRESPWCMIDHQVWHHPQLHSRVAGDGSGQTPIIGIRYRIVTKQALESLTKGIRLTPKSTRPRRPFTLSTRLPRSKQGAGIDNQEVHFEGAQKELDASLAF